MRKEKRSNDKMRNLKIITGVQKDPYGSVQVSFGNTVVLCSASVEERVPSWMGDKLSGWITAEYAMLPGATQTRNSRKQSGRAKEIQRLIGRSLRSAVDLEKLYPYTITVDCDVIQADGGTRTASITGGWVAVSMALEKLVATGKLSENPMLRQVAAVSCVVNAENEVLLDPDYDEDSSALTDMNFVMDDKGNFIEIQGTAEKTPFNDSLLLGMIETARKGISELIDFQNKTLKISK